MLVPVRFAFAISTPEVAGVLAWWGILLAAPMVLLRRRRRARDACERRSRQLVPRSSPTDAAPPASVAQRLTSQDADRSPAAPTGARLPAGTFEPLCRYVDFRRRLELAVDELHARLARLPADRWRIEPYPLTGERRNTLVLLGETGVFVVSATYAPGHWDDVVTVDRLARKIELLLPGYPGDVQRAICYPFSPTRPRLWHRADENGDWVSAWVLGGDSIVEWLEHFGPDHGLSATDLARFDELTRPNWLRPAVPAAPSWPPLTDLVPPRAQQ